MTVMVGGRDADVGQCWPLFEAIAANIFHVGPSGAGCAAKLVTQYLGYTGFIAALEGMLVAAKAGIDLDVSPRSSRSAPGRAGPSTTSPAAFSPAASLRRHARHRRQGHGSCGGALPRDRGAGITRRARRSISTSAHRRRAGAARGFRSSPGYSKRWRGRNSNRAKNSAGPLCVWIPARLGPKYGAYFPIVDPTKDRVRPAVAFAV